MVYLSDAVPVDDDALGVERVLELDVDGVAGAGADGRAGELPVDADHHLLLAVRRPEHVADLPLEVPGLRRRGAMRPGGARQEGAAHRGQQRKPHGWLALQAAAYATPNRQFTHLPGIAFQIRRYQQWRREWDAEAGWR